MPFAIILIVAGHSFISERGYSSVDECVAAAAQVAGIVVAPGFKRTGSGPANTTAICQQRVSRG